MRCKDQLSKALEVAVKSGLITKPKKLYTKDEFMALCDIVKIHLPYNRKMVSRLYSRVSYIYRKEESYKKSLATSDVTQESVENVMSAPSCGTMSPIMSVSEEQLLNSDIKLEDLSYESYCNLFDTTSNNNAIGDRTVPNHDKSKVFNGFQDTSNFMIQQTDLEPIELENISAKNNVRRFPSTKRKSTVSQVVPREEIIPPEKKIPRLTEDDSEIYAKYWACSFRKLSAEQQVFAKKGIDDLLLYGQLNLLTLHNVSALSHGISSTHDPLTFDSQYLLSPGQSDRFTEDNPLKTSDSD